MAKSPSVQDIHADAIRCLSELWTLAALSDRRMWPRSEDPPNLLVQRVDHFMRAIAGLQQAYHRGKERYEKSADKSRLDFLGDRQIYGTAGFAPYEITFKAAEKAYLEVCTTEAYLEVGRAKLYQEVGRVKDESEVKTRWGYELLGTFKVPVGDVEQISLLLRQASPASGKTVRKQAPGQPTKLSWTQPELNQAIRKHKAERASRYYELVNMVSRRAKGAKKAAQEMFGRNAIVRALSVKSPAMVSKSPVWHEIADDLDLRCKANEGHQPHQPTKIGLDMALEQDGEAKGDPVVNEVTRNETIRIVRRALPGGLAEPTIEQLGRGDMTDDQARALAEEMSRDC